jgi:hypothetical protein
MSKSKSSQEYELLVEERNAHQERVTTLFLQITAAKNAGRDVTDLQEELNTAKQARDDINVKIVEYEKPNRLSLGWLLFLLSGVIWGMFSFPIPSFEGTSQQPTAPIQSPR